MESVGGSLRATSDFRSPTVLVAAELAVVPNSPDMVTVSCTADGLYRGVGQRFEKKRNGRREPGGCARVVAQLVGYNCLSRLFDVHSK